MPSPILIVGAGPTGLTAAYDLARLGVPVRIVEKATAPSPTSRALVLHARTLELLQHRGLAGRLLERGRPLQYATVYGDGEHLFQLDFSHVPSRFGFVLSLSQAETETVLAQALAELGVEVEWGTALIAVAQAGHVEDAKDPCAVLRHPDGTLEDLRPSWIVSAEGAHSLVRHTLDLPFEGDRIGKGFILGDVRIHGELDPHALHMFGTAEGVLGVIPMKDDVFRIIASDIPGQAAPSLDLLQAVFTRRSQHPATLETLLWSSRFDIDSRMVDRLRVGRFLLAGDAAHVHSPAGGQGMNTGIQDAINLAWKLAAVSRGEAPLSLLDTYEAERLPVIRDVLFGSKALTKAMRATSPTERFLLEHLGPVLGALDSVQEKATIRMSQVAIGYHDSPLSEGLALHGSVRAGDRLPDFVLEVAREGQWRRARAQDLVDPRSFTLLHTSPGPMDVPSPAFALRRMVRPQQDDPTAFLDAFSARPVAILVRPDGYVAMSCALEEAQARLDAYAQDHLR